MNEQQEAAAREAFEALIPAWQDMRFTTPGPCQGEYKRQTIEREWQAYLAAYASQQAVIDARDAEIVELRKELIPPTPRSVVIERARERIAELEQEIARLRACVDAADEFRSAWGSSPKTTTRAYDAAMRYDAARALIGGE